MYGQKDFVKYCGDVIYHSSHKVESHFPFLSKCYQETKKVCLLKVNVITIIFLQKIWQQYVEGTFVIPIRSCKQGIQETFHFGHHHAIMHVGLSSRKGVSCSTDAQWMVNGCLTDGQQMVNGCSMDAQRMLNAWSTHGQHMVNTCSTHAHHMLNAVIIQRYKSVFAR